MKYIALIAFIAIALPACKKSKSSATPKLDSPAYSIFNGSIDPHYQTTAAMTNDNNIAIIGYTATGATLFMKISQSGNQLIRKEFTLPVYSGAGSPELLSIVQTKDNGYLVCGQVGVYATYMGSPTVSTDMYLLKLNENGDTLWSKRMGGDNEDYANMIIATKDGNYLICGETYGWYGAYTGSDDVCLVKIDQDGNTIWTNSFTETEQQTAFSITETKNGEYLVTGTNEPTGDGRIAYLLKVAANGDKLWESNIGPVDVSLYKWAYGSAECTNGDLMTVGMYKSQMYLLKTDKNGSKIWEKTFTPIDSIVLSVGLAIKANADNTFTVMGYSYNSLTASRNFIMKIDADGNKKYLEQFGDINRRVNTLLKGAGDDNLMLGSIYSGPMATSFFLTRTDKDGNYK